MAKETMTVRTDAETRDAIAASVDRDRSYVVNQALRVYVDVHPARSAEADAGKFVSTAEMNRVLSRLRRK
jgi:predicted transcriptional regulator